MRRPAFIVFPLALLALASCSEPSNPEPTSGLGVLEFDSSTADRAFHDGPADDGSTDSAVDALSEPPPPPPELRASECPTPDLPAAANPLDALRALAVTETRFYVAAATALYAFERVGGCPGARAAGFGTGGVLPLRAEALAGANADRVVVATESGTLLLSASGVVLATCGAGTARSLAFSLATSDGYAAFGSQIDILSENDTSCSLTPAGFPNDPVFAIHAVAVDAEGSAIVASVATPGARPVLRRERPAAQSELIDSGTACSARALVRTQLGIATLDPTCNRVRFLDVPGERYAYSFAGEIGRALADIPSSTPQALALGTVSDPGVAPRLRMIEAIVPGGD